jgi:small subunit ribosomal protein S20
MPLIQSAKKKLRKDIKRTEINAQKKQTLKSLIKNMRRTPSAESCSSISSALDKAVKTKLIHKNKASRLKSRLSKGLVASK